MTGFTSIGRYQILGEIGRGAMGVVYRARDPQMERVVAIKTIQSTALSGPQAQEYRDRFTREARAAGRLSHPGIVSVYDVGDHEGLPYLVMEYVPGRTLESALNSGERFPFDRIEELGEQISVALGYAHRNGVVHRDVKPANILLAAPEGQHAERAKITDLGIAKLSASQITTTGQLLGTPSYMPPEQFTGAPVDGRADLFSVGVILYWMATGDKPFAGDTITAVSYKIVHTETIPPRRLNPAVPLGLEVVILKCLQKDPARRYQTGDELASDLATVRAGGTPQAALGPATGSEATVVGVPAPKRPQRDRPEDQTAFGPATPPASPGVRVVTPETPSEKLDRAPPRKFTSTLALAGLGVLAVIVVASMMYRHRAKSHAEMASGPVAAASAASTDLTAQRSAPAASSMDIPIPTPISGAEPGSSSSVPESSAEPKPGAASAKKSPPKSGAASGTRSGPKTAPNSPAPPAKIDAPLPAAVPTPIVETPEPVTAPSKAPANAAPAKSAPLNPNENAKLHVDAGRVPDSVGFIILMDGQPLYERADASAAGANEEPIIPPGQHEFRVISGHNSVKLGDSNSVRGEFQVKKKKALHIELRDSATGKTLSKSSKVADGQASFVIELKSGLILF